MIVECNGYYYVENALYCPFKYYYHHFVKKNRKYPLADSNSRKFVMSFKKLFAPQDAHLIP